MLVPIKVDNEDPNYESCLRGHKASRAFSESGVSTSATLTSQLEEFVMADKSPNQHNVKKSGKSLKEKRNEKHLKKESKKGILGA